jgi:trehalose-6-phosphate synthase
MSSLYSVYLTRSLVSESALIAAKYTEESVDEMMKPDADTEVYKERMVELRKKVKRDIYAWTKSFVNEAQRQPSKQERKDLASAMFRAYTGVRA